MSTRLARTGKIRISKVLLPVLSVLAILIFSGFPKAAHALDEVPRHVEFRMEAGTLAIDLNNGYTGEIGWKTADGGSGAVSLESGRGLLEWPGARQQLLYLHPAEGNTRFNGRLFHLKQSGPDVRARRIPLWMSIVPPLLAIGFALVFREVIISLFAGIVFGAWALYGFSLGGLFQALLKSVEYFVLEAFVDGGHAAVIIFSMLIGGMVAVISRNGGMQGVVNRVSKYANSARNTQLVTWLMGIGIFFDDYANTLIVGNTLRPVTDRFRISREKLAYIVDSTAAPIAAIALVTTWIGAELGYIRDALDITGLDANEYLLFLQSLKYSYYPVLTIVFIFMLIWMGRDYGPMYRAEHRARTTGKLVANEGLMQELGEHLDPDEGTPHYAWNAVLPVLTVIGMTIIGLVATGMESLRGQIEEAGVALQAFGWAATWNQVPVLFEAGDPGLLERIGKLIGSADSYTALLWASVSGVTVSVLMSLGTRTLSLEKSINAMLSGFKTMLPTMVILLLAWSLAHTTDVLHTADFLIASVGSNLRAEYMPAIVFLLAAVISFSTGSSWSTMAILYPLALPLTWNVGVSAGIPEAELLPIFQNVIAVVLAGSVLGDHCSPISDTTVLSSLASSCHHIDHVRTQLPYAMTVGIVSVLVGGVLFAFLPIPWYINYVLGTFLLYAVIRNRGKLVPEPGQPVQNG